MKVKEIEEIDAWLLGLFRAAGIEGEARIEAQRYRVRILAVLRGEDDEADADRLEDFAAGRLVFAPLVPAARLLPPVRAPEPAAPAPVVRQVPRHPRPSLPPAPPDGDPRSYAVGRSSSKALSRSGGGSRRSASAAASP